jgi:hypothetical protein
MCTLAGTSSQFSDDTWTSSSRPPPLFPDAVTLLPSPSVPGLMSRIDPAPGASIKDSFAALDLEPLGFRVLFDAQWIVRPPPIPCGNETGATWSAVRDEAMLGAWNEAWSGTHGTSTRVAPAILARDEIALGARFERGAVAAGAILNRSDGVVGVSNVFTVSGRVVDTWTQCVAFAGARFPGLPLVGYETADELAPAEECGFDAVGPLRIWIRD